MVNTPMPRMMMAVLRLLVPTRPTMGRIRSITFTIKRRPTVFLALWLTYQESSRITATLANSAG